MRRYSAVFLLSVMSVQVFYNLGITIYWLANRAYIASELCVKKDEPRNCCKGKCYLKQKLADSPEKTPAGNAPKSPALKKGFEEVALLPAPVLVLENIEPAMAPVRIPVQQDMFSAATAQPIFHPPSAV